MWDKADIRIPFAFEHVNLLADLSPDGEPCGFVDISKYEFPASASVVFVDGKGVHSTPKAQTWNSISSALSQTAIGFFPEGNGFYQWPHISVKASPSKILQGHNVFGTEDIKPGIMQMLANVALAFPKLYEHLDIPEAEIRYLDSTYSALIPSEYKRAQVIRMFENLFPNKDSISRYQGYMQANKYSEYRRQKVYYKHQELLADLEDATKKRQSDKVAVLSDERLQDFAFGRIRFEATTGYRALETDGIPLKLFEFLKFHDWYERTHKQPLAQLLWHRAFDRYFSQFEGHTMKNVDDNSIRLKIDAKYIKVKDNGKVCKRKANAIFRMYRDIKREGYDQLASEKSSTFFRNVKHLEDAGISRALLKSLDPDKPNENVVSMVQLINVDFSQQRPDWYVEPESGFDDRRRHLRLIA
ncbi:II/X family phage/plasmid replication protein [Sinobacterium caligoides]|uniref:II/X family phage/plasmid replication protein n=1 Tax=Sinobacterium caligoides TaxID=933926 RepID=A0A3N2DJG6_9GAMM|nr:phage/plasmid replication protein, II/X family [Sinobacterium caligoides]ROR99925.1 II/X family phage/plasmid replication protein [Sinobacterium caligoides]